MCPQAETHQGLLCYLADTDGARLCPKPNPTHLEQKVMWCVLMCGSVASENVFSQQSVILKTYTHTLTHPYIQVPLAFQISTKAFVQQSLMLFVCSYIKLHIHLGGESLKKFDNPPPIRQTLRSVKLSQNGIICCL